MTTIAFNFKDKQIAVDSRCTSGMLINNDNANKVIENKLGIWFFAGSVADRLQLVSMQPGESTEHDLDGAAILIRDGEVFTVYLDDGRYCEVLLDCNETMGSGSPYALAAMDFGCSAYDAVAYAMKRDIGTGGAIQLYDMHGIIEPEISKDKGAL